MHSAYAIYILRVVTGVRVPTLILYISISNNVSYMHVENGSKDLKRYQQISRRVRDTLARHRQLQVSLQLQDIATLQTSWAIQDP